MRKLMLGFVLALSLVSAAPLFAMNLGGSPMIIPVVGRFPGTGGTQWRTDVFLGNPGTPTQTVTLKFYPTGGAVQQATVTMGPFSTATLPDVVLNTFGMANAGGVLEVSVPGGFSIQARATIYNSGNPAGVFGQGVPGIAKDYLSRQAFLFGLSGISGSRVNIGAANPNDVPVEATFYVVDATGAPVATRTTTIAPHAYVQYSDIFNAFGIPPQASLTVNIYTNALPIYGYSSEVRNDTGDAVFNFGTSPNS
jgi:hypothetical protein